MEQVAVTGLGAHLTNANGVLGGWDCASHGAGVFSVIPPQSLPWLDLIERESQGLFPLALRTQSLNLRHSVVWSQSKNNFAAFEQWTRGADAMRFFSDYDAHFLAHTFGFGGQILCPVSACASGSHAIILGARLIESGQADVVLCGASEPPQHPLVLAAYRNMGALSPSGIMRPFDKRRDGFVPASGAGFLILESLSHAQNRGAKAHALLTGYSMKADATHLTSMCPTGDSVVRAIEEATGRSGETIGYINAHGTATNQNDALEAKAIYRTFGDKVPVSSTKALTGHLLGASGAVEAVISVLALENVLLPPNLGLDELEFDLCVVKEEIAADIHSVLSLNYGFGGHVGALVFGRIHSHREHGEIYR